MAEFFEELGRKLSETAENVGKKTSEMVELQKSKNQIRTLEKNNQRDLEDLGKMIYDRFTEKGEVKEEFAKLCTAIREREQEIEKIRQEMGEKTMGKACPTCHGAITPEMLYCSKCGRKLSADSSQK